MHTATTSQSHLLTTPVRDLRILLSSLEIGGIGIGLFGGVVAGIVEAYTQIKNTGHVYSMGRVFGKTVEGLFAAFLGMAAVAIATAIIATGGYAALFVGLFIALTLALCTAAVMVEGDEIINKAWPEQKKE